MPAFKLKLLVLFYTPFPKDFGEAKQNCQKKCLHLTVELFNLAKARTSPNRLLCFSDVMFTRHGKLGEFIPASKLASTFVPTFIGPRRFSPPPREQNILRSLKIRAQVV